MSFRLKTIIGVALIEGPLLLILVLLSLNYLTESSEKELSLRAQVTAETMANLTRDAVLATDLARLDSVAKQMLPSPDIVYVRVKDSERLLAEAGAEEVLERPFAQDSGLEDVDDGIFDVGVNLTEGEFVFGRVELGLSVSRATALIAAARRYLSGIAMVEMLLVALFSGILGVYLTRGLNSLAHAAQSITEGDYGTQVRVNGDDELANTSRAFNTMSSRLAKSQRAMERSMSESKELTARLADRELRLSTILDTAVDSLITIDKHGIIDGINQAGARLFGYQVSELVGRNVSILMPEPHRSQHDDYLQRYLATQEARVIGRGRRVAGLRKDGTNFPIDLSVSEMVIDDLHLFVGLIRDLTDQVHAEEAARRSEAMRAAIINANLDGLVTIDAQDRIIEFSAKSEEIFGHSREAVMGQRMSEILVPPELRDRHIKGMQHYFATGEGPVLGDRIEVPALRSDGEQIPVELTVQPIQVDGETFFTALVRDISERKAQEKALMDARHMAEVASKAKSRFLAHMSHEIRSPLNAVLGSLGLLLDAQLREDQRLYVKTAENSGKILLSLINDILDFSKIEAGHLKLENTDFEVRHLVNEVIDTTTFKARDKAVHAAAVVDPGVVNWVHGDTTRLRQILVNLLDNALKFTQKGGVVLWVEQIQKRIDGVNLRFTVEDTGIGIPAESQATLFDEFQQVDDSDSTRHGGTGLGLSICQGLAGLMGGSIELDSEPGHGSRFWLDIPLQLPATAPSGKCDTSAVPCRQALAVGFQPLIAAALTRLCATAGCTIDTVTTAKDAAQLMSGELEVVLVDAELPAGELDSLGQSARAFGVNCLLLLAAAANPTLSIRVNQGPYDALVQTPLTIDRLLDACRTYPLDGGQVTRSVERAAAPLTGRLLLAEDNLANQMVASVFLRNAGYTVDIANNGREATDMFALAAYDAILMDVRMPEVDGLEAAAAIRRMPAGDKVPIIALTANALQEDVDRCLAGGMNEFLSKPFDKRQLLEIVARLLSNEPAAPSSPIGPNSVSAFMDADVPLLDSGIIEQLAMDVTPEVVPSVIKAFVSEAVVRAQNLDKALEEGSMETVEVEAHTLKSSAGTFGAARLQMLTRNMEAACRKRNRQVATDLGGELQEILQQTLVAYRDRFDFLSVCDD
ncbi:MAG: PAS domain S-box protein [Gammaproteobacteria bacterium]|nr:PAS domain S-box protein [Gammaproteobacteria bacterium]